MTDYMPISCSDYDILETTCLFQYEIEIFTAYETFIATAKMLEVKSNEEYLVVVRQDSDIKNIRVDRICKIIVLTRPSYFEVHEFECRND